MESLLIRIREWFSLIGWVPGQSSVAECIWLTLEERETDIILELF
jgi:hypothetical protein